MGKEIQLRSSGGPQLTTIDGTGEDLGTTVLIAPQIGQNALLRGFTITGGTHHGVLVFNNTEVTIRDCIFENNSSNFAGGGLHIENNSHATVVNSVFVDNVAFNGGGMGVITATATVVNCTFSRNIALSDAIFSGGGLFNLDGFVTIRNSVFWGNTGPESIEEQQIGGANNLLLFSVDYCNIEGLSGAFEGEGNIGSDPMFVDPDMDDFRLRSGSAAIDAGRNDAVPADIFTDLNGNARFVDDPDSPDCAKPGANCGAAPIVDMGAFEIQGGGEPIPTTSQWGLIAMTLLLLTAGSLVFPRHGNGRTRGHSNGAASLGMYPVGPPWR